MAKPLAEFFFGDATRLVRFDMSEYATPAAVERLVGGAGYQSEGLLTSRVREQPFSVVLLDEFEKAQGAFFDLMLQVLGEGRLTDAAGRTADFGNTIVVMTSNLGAQSFQQAPFGLRRSQDGGVSDASRHFVESVRDHFRPEMFNRIDRVVPFAPLGAEVILGIARRELDLVRQRAGVKLRGIELEVTEDAVRHLADHGFDARYGARPLKRTIERELLVPLAEGLNGYAEDAKLVARAIVEAGKLAVTVRAAGDGNATGPTSALASAAGNWSGLRRRMQQLARCPAVTGMHNELFALQRLKERLEAMERAKLRSRTERGKQTPTFVRVEDNPRLAEMPRLTQVSDALTSLATRVRDGETAAILALAGDLQPAPDADRELAKLQDDWSGLLLSVYSLRYPNPDRAVLAFFGQNLEFVYGLARAYYDLAEAFGAEVQIWTCRVKPRAQWKEKEKPEYDRLPLDSEHQKPAAFFEEQRGVAAIAFVIRGPHAYARFAGENGMQAFREEGKVIGLVSVDVSRESWTNYTLPKDCARIDQLDPRQARRAYDLGKNIAEDSTLAQEFRWTGRQWARVVREAADAQLRRATEALLAEGTA